MDHRIIFGDAIDVLRTLDAESVDMCATSPPYWNLRDYKHADQIGLEATPEAYVARLVEVFGEVRRVLKPRATCWVNLGDSYANTGVTCGGADMPGKSGAYARSGARLNPPKAIPSGLKPKDLCGIPWRVAFALQADGWWLRNDIIWAKKNPMPESVTDRFSNKHEHVFMLSKQARYWFDLDAVRESHSKTDDIRDNGAYDRTSRNEGKGGAGFAQHTLNPNAANPLGKNPGDVWTLATKPTPYAHFATWPPDLVERMILAGCPPKVCAKCGEPWEHRVEKTRTLEAGRRSVGLGKTTEIPMTTHGQGASTLHHDVTTADLGYHLACKCQQWSCQSQPGLVLDPFCGSGTTTQVARKLGRRSIGIELNPEYEAVMRERLDLPSGGSLFADEDLGVEFVTLDVAEVTG